MSSHATMRACSVQTFLEASAAKCAIASCDRADRWGPHTTANLLLGPWLSRVGGAAHSGPFGEESHSWVGKRPPCEAH
jgi:hypothetical protein